MLYFEAIISGIDGAGFVWENVLYIQGIAAGTDTVWKTVKALNSYLQSELLDIYQALLPNNITITALSTRGIYSNSTPTYTVALNMQGSREASICELGAICAKLSFIPTDNAKRIGGFYIPSLSADDYVQDVIQDSFLTAVADLLSALLAIDGSPVDNNWQLGMWNALLATFDAVQDVVAPRRITTLNKRIRA